MKMGPRFMGELIGVLCLTGVLMAPSTLAQESSTVAENLKALESRLQTQEERLAAQEKEIQGLREELRQKAEPVAGAPEDLSAIVEKIIEEQRVDKKGGLFSKGVPSLKGEWWKLGGKLEFEFLDTQADRNEVDVTTSAREADGASTFQLDKVVLKPEVFFNDDITMVAVIEFAGTTDGKANTVNVDEAYLRWENFLEYVCLPKDPTNTYLMVGDMNYFEKTWKPGKRGTENYDLVTNTFFRDDDLGIRVGGHMDLHPLLNPFWYAQISNGDRIDDRSIQDASGPFEMLVYDENNVDYNNHKMWRGGVGNSMDMEKCGTVDVLGWFSTEDLDLNDINGKIDDVAGFSAAFPDPEVEANVYGFIGSYELGDFQFVAQFAHGPVSNLEIDTYEFRPSYKIHLPGVDRGGRKFFTAVELLYSYSRYQLKNLGRVPVDARTWDRQKHIVAAIFDITKNITLKCEYSVNNEETGGPDVQNNEFLAHLSIAF